MPYLPTSVYEYLFSIKFITVRTFMDIYTKLKSLDFSESVDRRLGITLLKTMYESCDINKIDRLRDDTLYMSCNVTPFSLILTELNLSYQIQNYYLDKYYPYYYDFHRKIFLELDKLIDDKDNFFTRDKFENYYGLTF